MSYRNLSILTVIFSFLLLAGSDSFSQSGHSPTGITNTYSILETDSLVDTLKTGCFALLPTAFTPNGDGENDLLKVRGNNFSQVYLEVYNRWGEKVYEAKDSNTGWDGTYKGVLLNSEVFVYYLRVTCPDKTKLEKKGTITLIR